MNLVDAFMEMRSSDATAAAAAGHFVDSLLNDVSVLDPLIGILVGRADDAYLKKMCLICIENCVNRCAATIPDELMVVLQNHLVELLQREPDHDSKRDFVRLIRTVIMKCKKWSDNAKGYVVASPDCCHAYFELAMHFVLTFGNTEQLYGIFHMKIQQGLTSGSIQVALGALYLMLNYTKNVLRNDCLVSEFGGVIPELFGAILAEQNHEHLAIFCELVLSYFPLTATFMPFEQAVMQLSNPEISYTNSFILRDFVNGLLLKREQEYPPRVILEVMGKLVEHSIRLLSTEEYDESTTTCNHFFPGLSRLTPDQVNELVCGFIEKLVENGTIPAILTALALVEAGVQCTGCQEFVCAFLVQVVSFPHDLVKKVVFDVIFDQEMRMREFIEESAAPLVAILCEWSESGVQSANREFVSGNGLYFLIKIVQSVTDPAVLERVAVTAFLFLGSDNELEFCRALVLLKSLVFRRAPGVIGNPELIHKLVEFMKVQNMSVHWAIVDVLSVLVMVDRDTTRPFISPELYDFRFGICDVKFACHSMTAYGAIPEVQAFFASLEDPMLSVIEATIADPEQSVVSVAHAIQSACIIWRTRNSNENNRPLVAIINALPKVLPPNVSSPWMINYVREALVMVEDLMAVCPDAIRQLEHILNESAALVNDEKVLIAMMSLSEWHIDVAGGLNRSTDILITVSIHRINELMSGNTAANHIDFLLACKRFYSTVLRENTVPVLAESMFRTACSYLSNPDNNDLVSIFLQFMDVLERFVAPVRDADFIGMVIGLVRHEDEDVAISAAELLYDMSREPEIALAAAPVCAERLAQPCNNELVNFLVGILAAGHWVDELIEQKIGELLWPRTYECICAWIAQRFAAGTANPVNMIKCVLSIFAGDVTRYISNGDLAQQTVQQLAVALNAVSRDSLQALSLEVVGNNSPIEMIDQILASAK